MVDNITSQRAVCCQIQFLSNPSYISASCTMRIQWRCNYSPIYLPFVIGTVVLFSLFHKYVFFFMPIFNVFLHQRMLSHSNITILLHFWQLKIVDNKQLGNLGRITDITGGRSHQEMGKFPFQTMNRLLWNSFQVLRSTQQITKPLLLSFNLHYKLVALANVSYFIHFIALETCLFLLKQISKNLNSLP